MKRYSTIGVLCLAGMVAISLHIYRSTGLLPGLFAFALFYLSWELMMLRIRLILDSPHPDNIAHSHRDIHITTAYLGRTKEMRDRLRDDRHRD